MAMLIKFTVPNQPGVVDFGDLHYILPVIGIAGEKQNHYYLGSAELMYLDFKDDDGEGISLVEFPSIVFYQDKPPVLGFTWNGASESGRYHIEDVEILSDYPMPTIIRDRK